MKIQCDYEMEVSGLLESETSITKCNYFLTVYRD